MSEPVYESQFSQRLKSLGFKDYEAYLASDLWKKKKAEYAASGRPRLCLSCGDLKYMLHHLTYARLGNELMEDFTPLCNSCHHRLHLEMKEKGWKTSQVKVLILLSNKSQPVIKPKVVVKTPAVIKIPVPVVHKKEKQKKKLKKYPAIQPERPVQQVQLSGIISQIESMGLAELKIIAGVASSAIHKLKSIKKYETKRNKKEINEANR